MVRVVWTNQATQDIEAIAAYIERDSAIFAQLTVRKIYAKTQYLKDFPKMGSIVPEKKQENIRQLFEGSYRIIYRIESETLVHILLIYHSSRLLK